MAGLRSILKAFLWARVYVSQGPSYLLHLALWWVWPTRILRQKAACCPYPLVRTLLLRRSGIKVGHLVDVNMGVMIVGIGKHPPAVTLGDRVALGPNVCFVTSSYPDDSILNRHPGLKGVIRRFAPITVEADAWIGAGAILFPGITIGRGAVVGAGAVVRSDVPPFAVVAGVPARLIRQLEPMDGDGIPG